MTDILSGSSKRLASGQVRSLLALGLSGEADGSQSEDGQVCARKLLTADPALLQQALDDLRTPCPVEGPFSFYRLSGADQSRCPGVEGHSWLKLLSSRETDSATRSSLHAIGSFLRQSGPTELSRLTGAIIEALASSVDSQNELSSLLASPDC